MDKKVALLDATTTSEKTEPSVVESMQEALKKAGETVWDLLDSMPTQSTPSPTNHFPNL